MSGLVLASGSASRAQILRAAGLEFEVIRPSVDEDAVKSSLRAGGLSVRDQADALAEVKALSVSRRSNAFVIGADQMLECEGVAYDKPDGRAGAARHLQALRGKMHRLVSAAVLAKDGAVIWRHIETPQLRMRAFDDSFIETYLDRAGPAVTASVGAYQLEGLGAHLFERIDGDYFSILGLPLLPLLAILRPHGLAPA
jgi:septum formation protein